MIANKRRSFSFTYIANAIAWKIEIENGNSCTASRAHCVVLSRRHRRVQETNVQTNTSDSNRPVKTCERQFALSCRHPRAPQPETQRYHAGGLPSAWHCHGRAVPAAPPVHRRLLMKARRNRQGSNPIAAATSKNSSTSRRRSPPSYFATYDGGLSNRCATTVCVRPAAFRRSFSNSHSFLWRGVWIVFDNGGGSRATSR